MKTAGAAVVTACALSLLSSRAYAQTPPPPPGSPALPTSATPAAAHSEAVAPTPSEPVAPTAAEVRYRRVSVDVASTRPDAVLERRVTVKEDTGAFLFFPWRDSQSTWEQVCVAPCRGADLDRYSTYRVAAENGITGSRPFTLPQGDGAVHLQLKAGDRMANHAGVALGAAGIAALIVGGSLLIAGENADTHDDRIHFRNAGFATGAAGIVAMAVGIPLAILTRTCVYADDQPLRMASNRPRFTGNGFVF